MPEAADTGLVADPEDMSLRGNCAYALAALGRLGEAEAEIELLESRVDDNTHPFTLATKGMVMLLRGEKDQGRRYYEEALEEFKRKKQEAQYTDCLAFMARTLTVANDEDRDAVVKRAMDRFSKAPSQLPSSSATWIRV